ncbi:MAG: aryl-sulfate sulfotransferase [Bacteroidota bacterium]
MPALLRCRFALVLALGLFAFACDQSDPEPNSDPAPVLPAFVSELMLMPDPFGVAPLTARVDAVTTEPTSVEVVVAGQGSDGIEMRRRFEAVATAHTVPVLGLYPGTDNTVTLRFFDADGTLLGSVAETFPTGPLADDFPAVEIDVAPTMQAKPGVNLVSYFGHRSTITPQRAFAFDAVGDIRWALDFTGDPILGSLFYDNGVERLANGNLYFADRTTSRIYEVTMLGQVVNTWDMPGYTFHHQVLEKPNGNFLATVNKIGLATVEDHVIEIDRASGAIVNVWDLNAALDNQRRAWPTDLADLDIDWFHANAVEYDAATDAIIVSGRTQGVVKLTTSNEVVWMLAPHRDWGTAGDGTDLTTRLLQPLDAASAPITEAAVLDGSANHPDFEWAWYQHAPTLMPDGRLLVFDNGDTRNYVPNGSGPLYSRAVAYRIDDVARTIQQTWQYGKERGAATYSRIVSDVDVHAETGTVLFTPGAAAGSAPHGKIVEVDPSTQTVVFEATVTPPTAPFGITFHRVERLSLYPE